MSPAGCSRARPNTPAAALCQDHRDLVEASNQLARRYDGTVSGRNALVREHAHHELIDAYNWGW
jgi:hypothetical protein